MEEVSKQVSADATIMKQTRTNGSLSSFWPMPVTVGYVVTQRTRKKQRNYVETKLTTQGKRQSTALYIYKASILRKLHTPH
jgi:uncharacterized protein YgiB involved in biofilm formation